MTICTWRWGEKFGQEYVDRLRKAVQRNVKQPYQWRVFHPEMRDAALIKVPGCFCRLRMWDADWQERNFIDDRLVCIDLDTVITGPLDDLFDRDEEFVIMQGGNASNPCPYNGALQMLCAGTNHHVWNNFSIEAASRAPFFEFPDDQGWLSYQLPNAAGWKCGKESGVYVFRKPGWPEDDRLEDGAKLVTFSGWRNPEKFKDLSWVKEHWRD